MCAIVFNPNFYQVVPWPEDSKSQATPETLLLLPPLPTTTKVRDPIKMTIKNVFFSEKTGNLPSNDDFMLAQMAANAVITIKSANVWGNGTDARARLRANFAAFCTQIEHLETEDALLRPGATRQFRRRIAEMLPTLLADSLYFMQGVNAGFGSDSPAYIDLLPGMRLCLDMAVKQFVAPGSLFNEFVSAGQSYYDISHINCENGAQCLTFNPLANLLRFPTSPRIASPVDLRTVQPRHHYRIIYPAQLSSELSMELDQNMLLVGTDNLEIMNRVTQEIAMGSMEEVPDQVICIVLRGCVSVTAEFCMSIRHQGAGTYTSSYNLDVIQPLGVTLGHLLNYTINSRNPYILTQKIEKFERLWTDNPTNPGYKSVKIADYADFIPLVTGDIVTI
ncbi:MAG TPA: hypothetical protein V6C97_13210 [Oculatellaceae cyanobacterium]|nr:hypothetical protein [Aggregatilineaceae bacterium]